jgi:hypothetical protein
MFGGGAEMISYDIFCAWIGVYAAGFFGGLIVSWLIQRYGTFGSDHHHTIIKPPQNPI